MMEADRMRKRSIQSWKGRVTSCGRFPVEPVRSSSPGWCVYVRVWVGRGGTGEGVLQSALLFFPTRFRSGRGPNTREARQLRKRLVFPCCRVLKVSSVVTDEALFSRHWRARMLPCQPACSSPGFLTTGSALIFQKVSGCNLDLLGSRASSKFGGRTGANEPCNADNWMMERPKRG